MKKLRSIVPILFLSMILSGITSCIIRTHDDNGRHRGYHKSENNQHRRNTVIVVKKDNRDNRSDNQSDDHHDNH